MSRILFFRLMASMSLGAIVSVCCADPVTYIIDPEHTFPSFEADHAGGLSIWRGQIEQTTGVIILDREKKAGTVEINMDITSIDFGLEAMNERAMEEDILDVARFPTAKYVGTFSDFKSNNEPSAIEGEFTLHGVTQPLRLAINSFQCLVRERGGNAGVETCGADASASFNRDDFGVDFGLGRHLQYVNLMIMVEANRAE